MTRDTLTYCTNIHPGVSWKEHFEELQKFVIPVKEGLGVEHLGLGLRISAQMAEDLLLPNTFSDFENWCLSNGLWPSTFNVFPYSTFHGVEVKQEVYQPDWSKKERLEFSLKALKLAALFAKPESLFSLSTVPISYRPLFENAPMEGYASMVESAGNLAHWAFEAYQIQQVTGKCITLDLEPEPDCLLDDVGTSIDFFQNYLLTFGKEYLMAEYRLQEQDAVTLLFNHIGICFDTCHFSVKFLDLITSFESLIKAGIAIHKVQLSSALTALPHQKEVLSSFAEPVYLHQTYARLSDGSIKGFRDLPLALAYDKPQNEIRSHFHLPLYYTESEPIGSTADETAKFIQYLSAIDYQGAVEIETYTYNVWPGFLKQDLRKSIIQEFEWVKNLFL